MGTFRRSKISLTESVISFPTPSPGINVAVYTPPYLVGPCERQSLYIHTLVRRGVCAISVDIGRVIWLDVRTARGTIESTLIAVGRARKKGM